MRYKLARVSCSLDREREDGRYSLFGALVMEARNQAANEMDLPIVTIMRQSQDWIIGGSRQPTSEPS
jgi:hypothetical protein